MTRNRMWFVRLSVFAVFLVMLGCDASQPSLEQVARDVTQQSANPQEGTRTSWPPAPKVPVDIASNILATNYLVVLDNSGSMGEHECSGGKNKFDVARDALAKFSRSLHAEDNLGLVVFNGSTGKVILSLGTGDKNRADFLEDLRGLSADEGTPLYGATMFAYNVMVEQAQHQLGYGIYRMVILTDGHSQDQNPGPLAMEIVKQSPIEIHAIGFCVGEGHSLNIPGFTAYYTANDPESLSSGLAAVQAEMPTFDATDLAP